MTELALVVMALLMGGVMFALGIVIGFYGAVQVLGKRVAAGMKAAGIDRDTAERIVLGIKRSGDAA